MAIYQQYYTSFRNASEPQSPGGFNVKAESPGMPSSAQTLLRNVIGYRIPRSLPLDAIEKHPVALRYFASNGEAAIAAVHSSGKDELGRDGNFFAHSLYGTPEQLTERLAPIFYWKSDFWAARDDYSETRLPVLADMEGLGVKFEFDRIWAFVGQPQRREWLHRLLCAVIDYPQSKRPIVILDAPDSIAYWIACAALSLPQICSRELTFSTYHHDPYTSPFMITGITSDSSFRFGSADYLRYFIINAETGSASEAPPSDYAKFVWENFRQEAYRADVVDLFRWLSDYEFASKGIGRYLDDLVNFRLCAGKEARYDLAGALKAVDMVLSPVLKQAPLSEDGEADLQTTLEVLRRGVRENLVPADKYLDTARQTRNLGPIFQKTASDAVMLLAELVSQKRADEAGRISSELDALYGRALVVASANSPQVIAFLADNLREDDAAQCRLVWELFGRMFGDLLDSSSFRSLLDKSFAAIQKGVDSPGNLAEAQAIVECLLGYAGEERFESILRLAGRHKSGSAGQGAPSPLEWIYYAKVGRLPLARRNADYWKLWSSYPSLYPYELASDLSRFAEPARLSEVVADWCEQLKSDPPKAQMLVNDALRFLLGSKDAQKHGIAMNFLGKDELRNRLSSAHREELVRIVADAAVMRVPDQNTAMVYEKLLRAGIGEMLGESVGVLEGVLALHRKTLGKDTVLRLKQHFARVGNERYRREAGELFSAFFASGKSDDHMSLIRVLHSPKHRDAFWEMYWAHFQKSLLEERLVSRAVSIIALWFNDAAQIEKENPRIVPEFFIELPAVLSAVRESKDYGRVAREFLSEVERHDWSPVVSRYIAKERSGLLRGLFSR